MIKEFLLEESNLNKLFEFLDNILDKDTVVLLRGDLASGKTTLVKNYLKYKKIEDNVTSPTFALQSIYDSNIYHYDIYNKDLSEFIKLGMLEEFEKEGIHFVEWGNDSLEKILNDYGFDYININILKKDLKRSYTIRY